MFIQLSDWIKSLTEKFQQPQTYGSALESYIAGKNPQDAGDVDRLVREFDQRKTWL
jgi:hypothetical protein